MVVSEKLTSILAGWKGLPGVFLPKAMLKAQPLKTPDQPAKSLLPVPKPAPRSILRLDLSLVQSPWDGERRTWGVLFLYDRLTKWGEMPQTLACQ